MIASTEPGSLQVLPIVVGVLGGLGMFLFGLDVMTDAVKSAAGRGMRALLARVTTNRFKAAFTGAFVTAVIQSSSVTTVLLVGFISAGLLTLQQSIGIIMGANIGSTVTAQIIAFKVTELALLMVAVGYGLRIVVKWESARLLGSALLGLGLLFLGMNLMSEATTPLRSHAPFIALMERMDNPVWAILFGMLFTALIQSSAATMGIVIVLATRGLITLEAGIALALGANIGTCITAILASLGKPAEARQAAAVHVLFNVLGVALWVGLIGVLAGFVRSLSSDVPRQIASAHTVFNVANTLVFIWFTRPLAQLVRRLEPDRPPEAPDTVRTKYLSPVLLGTPELALASLRREVFRLSVRSQRMLADCVPATLRGSRADLLEIEGVAGEVDELYERIVEFVGKLSQAQLTWSQTKRLASCVSVLNHVQNVSETIRVNLVTLATERLDRDLLVSDVTFDMLAPLRETVEESFDNAMLAFARRDTDLANRVAAAKEDVNSRARTAKRHLTRRLTADLPNREWTFRIESDVVENLKRLYYFAKRIAKAVLDEEEARADAA